MTLGESVKAESEVEHKVVAETSPDSGNASVSATPDSDRPESPGGTKSGVAEAVYNLTIQPTSGESFELQVSNVELVQELHQVLLEREATCHRTCFSLQLNGQTLDFFQEIRNCPDLVSGSVLHVVDEPYTLREARIHLRHVRELLRPQDLTEAANAIDGSSLTFLPSVNIQEKKDKDKPFDGQPPEYILPGSKDRPLTQMLPPVTKTSPAIKNIAISSFNPPPGPRKMKGDVLYIHVDTVEKRRLYITCCTKGFFLNSSTEEGFNPAISNQNKTVFRSLVDLLNAVSPGFKKAYAILVKKRSERNMMDRLPTPYPVYTWLAPLGDMTEDGLRAEDSTLPHKVGFEDHLPGQTRDWNEELQTTHDLPRTPLSHRIMRDRSVFKIHSDFVSAAVKGATAVIDGNVLAINPADDPKTHMFIWNNIFFSLGFDVKDHYKEFGGDAASFAATSIDLQGLKAYAAIDDSKLCTLGMVVVDYRGYRVTAQSIIPGILDKEQEQSVIYGSVDFGKTVVSSDKYHEVLEATAKELKILPHEVLSGPDGEVVKLYSSYETKGIIGNDGRQYVLDLLRTMPPDVHFMQDASVSENAKIAGYPRKHPHKLAVLRQELVEIFHESQCLNYIRLAAHHIRTNYLDKLTDATAGDQEITRILVEVSDGRVPETTNDVVKEALKLASEKFDSLKPDTFDVRFNPDCFSTTVKHAPTEDLPKQQKLLVKAAEFILSNQIPELVQSCVDCATTPVDGESLCELMHSRGINVRYLGDVAKKINATGATSYMQPLVMCELVSRCLKHVLRVFIYQLPQDQLATAISHILRAVFGSISNDGHVSPVEKTAKKNNKKGKKAVLSGEWSSLTTKSLWKAVNDEALAYYGYDLNIESVDGLVEQFRVQKISLLRRLCKCLGIQLLLKEYNFDSTKGKMFVEDDIQGLFPVMKHRDPNAGDAKKLHQRGQQAMQMGNLRDAYECIAESVNLMTSVYGAMHAELAQALRMLARLSYILGDSGEALIQQHKATIVSERCQGVDHGYTIVEYINLAHFAFANLYISASLRLLYRARYLLLVAHGENHPIMAQIDGNIGVILFAVQEYDSALKFLISARNGANANGEPKRLKTALIEHMIASAYAARADFRPALTAEKEAYSIYNNLFGANHEKTKESSDFLKLLTQQAVNFQKRMMEAKGGLLELLPIHIPQPSLTTILEVMNILNGIIIISMASAPEDKEKETKSVENKENKAIENNVKLEEEALD